MGWGLDDDCCCYVRDRWRKIPGIAYRHIHDRLEWDLGGDDNDEEKDDEGYLLLSFLCARQCSSPIKKSLSISSSSQLCAVGITATLKMRKLRLRDTNKLA